jgi:hypothetical protein
MAKPTIEELRTTVRAPVISATDPGYDEARAVHNGMFDTSLAIAVLICRSRAEGIAPPGSEPMTVVWSSTCR